jgi:hypothetical protein
MDYDVIKALHKSNPTLRALNKKSLPLAVGFLHYAFKTKHVVMLSQDVFREQLDVYIEYAADPEITHKPDYYINEWSSENSLIRIRSTDNGYMVQLSPHGERLIGWFEELQSRGMIGTESRLNTIITVLKEVENLSNENVEDRLAYLREQRAQIEAQIEHIEETQQVKGLSDARIRERLDYVGNTTRQLMRDFSLVEDRFRDIATTIQQAQFDEHMRRGDILETALDAHEQLEASDEGQSFDAFYDLLANTEQRNMLDALIRTVLDTPRLRNLMAENAIFSHLTSHLLAAGDRVNQTNQRLAEHLRRAIDTRNIIESRRVQTLAKDIKRLVKSSDLDMEYVTKASPFYSVTGNPIIGMPLSRPLYEPPEEDLSITKPRLASPMDNAQAFDELFTVFRVERDRLQSHITSLLMSQCEVTLLEVINQYPITKGITELIAYMQIAEREPQHSIEPTIRDIIALTQADGEDAYIESPRVIFRRRQFTDEVSHAG